MNTLDWLPDVTSTINATNVTNKFKPDPTIDDDLIVDMLQLMIGETANATNGALCVTCLAPAGTKHKDNCFSYMALPSNELTTLKKKLRNKILT